MTKFLKIIACLALLLSAAGAGYAQSALICNNPQNICSSPSFTFNASGGSGLTNGLNVSNPLTNPQAGNGANPNGPSNTGCFQFNNAIGPQWLLITISNPGNLGFVFGPPGSTYPQVGLYDWAMWVYTPSTCSNIFNNTQAPVSCNWNCASSGGTGMGVPPASVPGNTPSPCNYQPSIPVTTGQQYLILLSNFSAVTTSVSILNNGTAGLTCTSLLIPDVVACPNQTVVATATWAYVSNTTFTLVPGNIVQNSPSFTISAPATQGYTVLAQGLDSTNAVVNSIKSFSLLIAPNTPISVTNPSSVCVNGSANLTAALPTATAYTWVGPNGFGSTLPSVTLNNIPVAASGIYTVTANYNFPINNPSVACPQTATTEITVIPVNTVATVASFTQCEGTNVNLTASATGASGYSWSGPNAFASSVASPTLSNVTPASTGLYQVTAYFIVGGLNCISQGTTSVWVVPTPTVSMFPPVNVCQYDFANISASAQGALSYEWSGPAGFTSTTQTNAFLDIQPSQSGIYYATAFFAIGTRTCSSIGSSPINVVPVNSVTVVSPVSVCRPGNALLQASANTAVSYSWTGPNSFTAAVSNVVLYYPPVTATGIYTVTVAFLTGTLVCTNTNTVDVTVNPSLSFTIEPYKQLCWGTALQIDGPAGASSYTWTGGVNGFNPNAKDLFIADAQPQNSGIYTLSVSLGPCVSTKQVIIDVLDPIQFTLTPNGFEQCPNIISPLQVGATGGSENYAYTWEPSIYLSSPTGSNITVQPMGTTVYNVIAYDIACPFYTISHAFTIKIDQPPVPDLRLEKTEGCEPLCLFYNTRTQGQSQLTTFDFGGFQQMQMDSFTYCLTTPGTYTLQIQTKGPEPLNCTGIYTLPVPLVVYPKPHSDILWDPQGPTTTDNRVTFTPSYKYGTVISHDWMFGGTSLTGYDTTDIRNPVRTYENTGKFPVMLISQTDRGCIDTTVKILEIRDDFSVYIPNSFTPNNDGINDVFMVKGIGFKPEGFTMDLFDRWGNQVYSGRDVTKGWDGTVKGQLSADGVYVYRIRVVGANGEGRKEYVGHVTLLK